MRRVEIDPDPGRMLADTLQLEEVRPALWAGGLANVITVESKVKSPWKPT